MSTRTKKKAATAESLPAAGADPTRLRLWLAAGVAAFFVLHYFHIVGSLGVPAFTKADPVEFYSSFRFDEIRSDVSDHYGFYNLLTDAFFAGRTDLLLDPDPKLKALQNPLDPQQNGGIRMHDLSYFNGRYYMYFGPTPALVLFAPFRLLGMGKITEPYAVALAASGCLVVSILILFQLLKVSKVNPGPVSFTLGLVFLGAGGLVSYTLCRPIVYEVAIVTGALFSLLSILFAVMALQRTRRMLGHLGGAGLCVALAAGCRPNLIVQAAPFFALVFGLLVWGRKLTRGTWRDLAGVTVPCVCGILMLLSYNRCRFGGFFEFGNTYQLLGNIEPHIQLGWRNLSYLVPNLFNYFLNGPSFEVGFPFLTPRVGWFPSFLSDIYRAREASTGLFWCCPGLLGALTLGCVAPRGARAFVSQPAWLYLVASGGACLLFSGVLLHMVTMRYLLDFALPLHVAAVFAMLSLSEACKEDLSRRLAVGLSRAMGGCCLFVYFFFGFSGYYNLPKTVSPQSFFEWEDFFSPVSNWAYSPSPAEPFKLLEVLAPSGQARTSDGRDAFLFGPKPAYVRLLSGKSGKLQFSSGVMPVNGSSDCILSCGTWTSAPFYTGSGRNLDIEIPISAGLNRVEIRSKAPASAPHQPPPLSALIAPRLTFAPAP